MLEGLFSLLGSGEGHHKTPKFFFWGTLLQALGEYLWFVRGMGIILRLELQVSTYHK
jgi:hypothetical protein